MVWKMRIDEPIPFKNMPESIIHNSRFDTIY